MLKVSRELRVYRTRVPSVGVTLAGDSIPLADHGRLAGLGLKVCHGQLYVGCMTVRATKIWRDNMGAINMTKKKRRRMRPGSSCANILRNIRSIGTG